MGQIKGLFNSYTFIVGMLFIQATQTSLAENSTFEIAAVLLLVAIIAAIALAHRGPQHSKRQRIVQQILVNPDDRIRLVSMKSEGGQAKDQAKPQNKSEQ